MVSVVVEREKQHLPHRQLASCVLPLDSLGSPHPTGELATALQAEEAVAISGGLAEFDERDAAD